jgi:hypothetical protein
MKRFLQGFVKKLEPFVEKKSENLASKITNFTNSIDEINHPSNPVKKEPPKQEASFKKTPSDQEVAPSLPFGF